MALIDGLVTYFKMDDTGATTTVIDETGDNDGTANENVSGMDAAGKINTALGFNGTDNVINAGLPTVFEDIANNDFTISIWIYVDDFSNVGDSGINPRICDIRYDANNWAQIAIYVSNKITFNVNDTGQDGQIATNNMNTSTWYHLICTWDASTNTRKMYINNVEQTDNTPGVGGGSTQGIVLGRRGDNQGHYDGRLDEIGIWDKVLTSQERADLYNSGDGLEYPFGVTNMQINIGDDWKVVEGMQINIGDAWKPVEGVQINIGDAWKTIFP